MPTIFLIRHAHAGDPWEGDDQGRPLSSRGWAQAEHLAGALAEAGAACALASPAVRCRETLTPLADRLETEVAVRTELREGADPSRLVDLLAELAPAAPALCSHGDVIPEVIHLLAGRGATVEGPTGNSKASWWEIVHDGDRFTTARWHPPA